MRLLAAISLFVFFASCSKEISVTKRRYNKGYHFEKLANVDKPTVKVTQSPMGESFSTNEVVDFKKNFALEAPIKQVHASIRQQGQSSYFALKHHYKPLADSEGFKENVKKAERLTHKVSKSKIMNPKRGSSGSGLYILGIGLIVAGGVILALGSILGPANVIGTGLLVIGILVVLYRLILY